jgi:hypothetical protein
VATEGTEKFPFFTSPEVPVPRAAGTVISHSGMQSGGNTFVFNDVKMPTDKASHFPGHICRCALSPLPDERITTIVVARCPYFFSAGRVLTMTDAPTIDDLRISVLHPECGYEECFVYAEPIRCQRCHVGVPTFECDGSLVGRYFCKECVLAVLEEMKLRGAELWKRYEAELDPDDSIIDVEEHRARRLQIFGR